MEYLDYAQREEIITTYVNGNISDFRETVRGLSTHAVLSLIEVARDQFGIPHEKFILTLQDALR